jgi:hypothetical protein
MTTDSNRCPYCVENSGFKPMRLLAKQRVVHLRPMQARFYASGVCSSISVRLYQLPEMASAPKNLDNQLATHYYYQNSWWCLK